MTATVLAPTAATALLTDHYELTMLQAARRSGVANHRAVFEVFTRRLPDGRRYGVVAGLGRLIDLISDFRFDSDTLTHLTGAGVVDRDTADWLADYQFNGTIDAYREGELFFPGSPVLTVEAAFGEAVLLETIILSVLNHDSAVASAAARMVVAAEGRTLIDMGSRRTHEESAVAAARAAYVAGFDATSNLAAGQRYSIPTKGTAAHAFTLAHTSEAEAFRAQMQSLGLGTTLLVDTYDTPQGIRTAVEQARLLGADGPGAVRIDSGDLPEEVRSARKLLDELGATQTKIVVSSDLDEYAIEELADTPADVYGVGTRLVAGSGHPSAGFVYKLVAIADSDDPGAPLRPVAKKSASKVSVGGRKAAWRVLDDEGYAHEEHVVTRRVPTDPGASSNADSRPLQVRVFDHGTVAHCPTLDEIRAHHTAARSELRPLHLMTVAGKPAMDATVKAGG